MHRPSQQMALATKLRLSHDADEGCVVINREIFDRLLARIKVLEEKAAGAAWGKMKKPQKKAPNPLGCKEATQAVQAGQPRQNKQPTVLVPQQAGQGIRCQLQKVPPSRSSYPCRSTCRSGGSARDSRQQCGLRIFFAVGTFSCRGHAVTTGSRDGQ